MLKHNQERGNYKNFILNIHEKRIPLSIDNVWNGILPYIITNFSDMLCHELSLPSKQSTYDSHFLHPRQ